MSGETLLKMNNNSAATTPDDDALTLIRAYSDTAPDAIMVLDSHYRFIYVNQAYASIVHSTPEQIIGRTIAEVEGEQTFSLIQPRVDQCFAGQEMTFPSQVYLANPVQSLLHVKMQPHFDASGNVSHVFVTMRKSDAYFQTDAEAGFSQAQLSRSLASSPQPIIITSLEEGRIMQLNTAAFRLLGYEAEEILGQRMRDLCPDSSYRENLIEQMQQYKQCTIEDMGVRHKSGDIVHIEVVLNLTSYDGVPAILGFCRDKSDELRAAQVALEKAYALKLLNIVATTANEETSIEKVLSRGLQEVCTYTGFPIGHLLLKNEQYDLLEESDIWYAEDETQLTRMRQDSGTRTFAKGEGLPGQVLVSKDIVSLANWSEQTPDPIDPRIFELDIRSAFAFPLLIGEEVVAVMEFFSFEPQSLPQGFKEVLRPAGAQLGRAIERQQAQSCLEASNAHYQQLVNDVAAVVWEARISDQQVTFISTSVERILGYSIDQWYQPGFWQTHICREDQEKTLAKAQAHIANGENYEHEYRMRHADGSLIWFRDVVRLVDDANNGKRLRGVMFDVSEHKQLADELSFRASHDNLTSLFNRDMFEKRIHELLATDLKQSQHALCYLDLDQFKIINDSCGHLAGDALLHQLGALLRTRLRTGDMLARLGGDEFGILFENTSIEQAYEVSEHIRKLIQDFRFTWEDNRYSIGVSIGLIPIDQHSGTLKEVLSAADMACYAAKDAGRNRIQVYHPDDEELAYRRREMDWVGRITHALEENRFQLYVQPIRAINREARGQHYEVLLRMLDEWGKPVPPGAFLPAAERYNLSTQIDQWVVSAILDWLVCHPQEVERLTLCSINLSGPSLNSLSFLGFLLNQLKRAPEACRKLCFEITETAAIANIATATQFMEAVRALGCQFALDDFGSGLSSFTYLKNLPVDFLKIDGSFVVDISTDPIDYEMVRSINEIGHVMGKKTIAEFVEDELTLNALKRLGIDYAQGYHIGRPIPLDKKRI